MVLDQGQSYFHITYDDFDEQELDLGEILDSVIYHPELDVSKNGLQTPVLVLPEVNFWVVFVSNYDSALG